MRRVTSSFLFASFFFIIESYAEKEVIFMREIIEVKTACGLELDRKGDSENG